MNSSGGNEAENAELALYRLEEIDELLGSVTGDEDDSQSATLAQYLRSGQDLEGALRLHDEELRSLRDNFIQAHVAQAEQIAQLYHEFSASEQHIVDFEEEVLTFQRKLEGNANDIVFMQQQTDGLVRKVNNRRQVSNKINEVYSALQKCDSFCDVISTKDVDANYLANLRELDRQLAFLSGNKALQHSAVDNEIRPKLTATAHKAGDKLQRFLTKKILTLAENPARTAEEQQALEQSAQFAFRFLQLYNSPVAKEITKLYIRYMSESYVKQFRQLLTQFSEASAVHADPLEPLVSAEEVRDVMSNRDGGAPSGNQVNPAPVNFPGRTLARRERSVSQHMRGFTDLLSTSGGISKAEALRLLRAATFEDTAKAVNALGVRYGKLHVDDAVTTQLNACNSWAWQFLRCFQALVNTCEAECRFIGNFFCVAGDVEGGEDYTSAEKIARAVLGRAIANLETSIMEDLPLVMERTEVLAGLRVLETVKQHLCTSLDPIPLLLLSGVLEMSKASLRNSLRTALKNDELAIAFLPTLKLSPFYRAPTKNSSWADILGNKPYCATLGPHPLVYRVCGVLGQLEYLNASAVCSSALTSGAKRAFDPAVTTFVKTSLAHMMTFIEQLKRRHASPLAQQVFACANIYTALATWRELIGIGAGEGPATAAAAAGTPVASHPASPGLGSRGTTVSRSQFEGAGDAELPAGSAATAASPHAQYLEGQLQAAIGGWVRVGQDGSAPFWGFLLAFADQASAALGPDFFDAASQPVSAVRQQGKTPTVPRQAPPAASLPPALGESATLKVAAELSVHWQTQAKAAVDVVRKAVQQSLGRAAGSNSGGNPSNPAATAALQRQCEELSALVLSAIFGAMTEANRQLCMLVAQYYSGNRELQSKLLNNTTVLHELSRMLELKA